MSNTSHDRPPGLRPARTVRDLMTSDVIIIDPDAPVANAVQLLADNHVTAVAVVDHHRRLLGVVSTTDLLNAEAESGDAEGRERLWTMTTVRDLMTPKPLTCEPKLELREAALQMDYGDVHRLFVEEDGTLVGVISRSDISRAFAAGKLG